LETAEGRLHSAQRDPCFVQSIGSWMGSQKVDNRLVSLKKVNGSRSTVRPNEADLSSRGSVRPFEFGVFAVIWGDRDRKLREYA
jgi:hypothetical protein